MDPSGWKVPVLVSNFGQETVMVEPFSEIGMIAQVSAIQPTMDRLPHPSCDPVILPTYSSAHPAIWSTSQYIVGIRGPVPIPGSVLTGHTDAVEHTIDTADSQPVRCAPRRMSPQKIKQEEDCVDEMLSGGQIEPSVVSTGGAGD